MARRRQRRQCLAGRRAERVARLAPVCGEPAGTDRPCSGAAADWRRGARPVAGHRSAKHPEPRRAAAETLRRALARHRRTRPRHLEPPRLGQPHHPDHRRDRQRRGRADRPRGGLHRRLCGRLGRYRADADHGPLPRLPEPHSRAGLRGRARTQPGKCDPRDRAHLMAGHRAARQGGDAQPPQQRLRGSRAADGSVARPYRAAPHRAALPAVRGGARDAEHGERDPDRGGPRLPRPRRSAANTRMGGDGLHRPPLHAR